MRKLLALTMILGVAVLVGGLADASGADSVDTSNATASGVKYDWMGSSGELQIVGDAGSQYIVYDSAGNPVAGGTLDANHVSFAVGNSGVGPDGTIVFVIVDNDVVAVTDPDWSW